MISGSVIFSAGCALTYITINKVRYIIKTSYQYKNLLWLILSLLLGVMDGCSNVWICFRFWTKYSFDSYFNNWNEMVSKEVLLNGFFYCDNK